mgnify:CR=1 FL=1
MNLKYNNNSIIIIKITPFVLPSYSFPFFLRLRLNFSWITSRCSLSDPSLVSSSPLSLLELLERPLCLFFFEWRRLERDRDRLLRDLEWLRLERERDRERLLCFFFFLCLRLSSESEDDTEWLLPRLFFSTFSSFFDDESWDFDGFRLSSSILLIASSSSISSCEIDRKCPT